VKMMSQEAKVDIEELRVDGGPTRNNYLMQFQSDMLDISVQVPSVEELSGIGVAYLTGITLGLYEKDQLAKQISRTQFKPLMSGDIRDEKYKGWKKAVNSVISAS
ncbi:MAG TPA: glycerol kinase, partial [Epulopiscium sp.]|nr:glycerol kinase [Candidatus Epulonipiscium sp.]